MTLPWSHCSDDRSPEAFRVRIEAATQMESVLGAGGKPNCLVIDEIDGAPTVSLPAALESGWAGTRASAQRPALHLPQGCHQCSLEHPEPQGSTGGRARGPSCALRWGPSTPSRGWPPDEAHHLHLQ